ncbi:MAG: hypothetical protein ACYCO3_04050 [Mycobacteriales bacterium]
MPWPAPLRCAAGLVALQGAALAVVCLVFLVDIFVGRPNDRATALFGAALGLFTAAVLIGLARPLQRGRRFARTPVVLIDLLALPVGAGLVQGARFGYAVCVILPALLTLALLAAPSARAPFEFHR